MSRKTIFQLVVFVKDYLEYNKSEIPTTSKFLEKVNSSNAVNTKIDHGNFSRMLNRPEGFSKGVTNTLMRFFLGKKSTDNVRLDEFFNYIKANYSELPSVRNSINEQSLKIGTGFTTWITKVIAPLYVINEYGKSDFDGKIQFVLSKYSDNELKWFVGSNDSPVYDGSTTKFIGLDLKEAMLKRQVDGVFLLKSTYQSLFKNEPEKPMLLSRMATGYGANLYVIRAKKNHDSKIQTEIKTSSKNSLSPRTFEDLRKICSQTDSIKGRVEILNLLGRLIKENDSLRWVFKLKNFTIKSHLKILLDFLNGELGEVKSFQAQNIYLTFEKYAKGIQEAKSRLIEDGFMCFAGFEPFNHNFYMDLERALEESHTLDYIDLNLSELVGERSSYCLYVWPETLRDKNKVQVIRDLIVANSKLDIDDSYLYNLSCLFNYNRKVPEQSNEDIPEGIMEILSKNSKKFEFHESRLDFINFLLDRNYEIVRRSKS